MRFLFPTGTAVLLVLTGCAEISSPQSNDVPDAAFSSVLLGFNNAASSFAGGPDGGAAAWAPAGRGPGHDGGHGPMGRDMLGGGLGDLFLGQGFGPHFGHGRFGDTSLPDRCMFNAATGRVACPTETRNGLTIDRSVAFADAAGAVQAAFDSTTTNTVNSRVSVSGTVTRRDNATSTVQHASDRTVSGLAAGSAQRTINGTSAGNETTTGTNADGAFTVTRVMGDTTKNVVIPVPTGDARPYPVTGSVTRSMQVTITRAGETTTSTRREVITFDGSDTARLVITRDGETKTCTLPLPRGRPTCQ